MPSVLPTPSNCCRPCKGVEVVNIPGPKGDTGVCVNGIDGIDAFTFTTEEFTTPAVNESVTITVASSVWAVVGQAVFIEHAGVYRVIAKPSASQMTVLNLGAGINAPASITIPIHSGVGPTGEPGVTEAAFNSFQQITVTEADSADSTLMDGFSQHTIHLTVEAGTAPYEYSLYLLGQTSPTGAVVPAGNIIHVRLTMPASTNPTIKIYDDNSDTLLLTINGEVEQVNGYVSFVFNGTQWMQVSPYVQLPA